MGQPLGLATYINRGRGATKAHKFEQPLPLAAALARRRRPPPPPAVAGAVAVILLRLAFLHVWDHVPRRPRGGLLLLLHAVALPELPAVEI